MIYEDLLENLMGIELIDSHEHFQAESAYVCGAYDFFDLLEPYVVDSLISSGMTMPEWRSLRDKRQSLEDRWRFLAPWIANIRFTTTFRALEISMQALYGRSIESVDDTIEISRRMAVEGKGLFDRILKPLHILKVCTFVGVFGVAELRDGFLEPIPTVSDFIPRNRQGLDQIESATGVRPRGMESLGRAIDTLFEYYRVNRIRALKFGNGYRRHLDFSQPDSAEAGKVLDRIINGKERGDDLMLGKPGQTLSFDEALPLDDWISERFFSLAEDAGLPVIFHVAMHAWNANNPDYAHAHHLTDMLFRHPRLRVEILHAGAPFIDEAILLARYFPCVTLNLTWAHVIDREITRNAIRSCVEALPLHKVTAFGGDCCYPQQVPGHLRIALENLAKGLQPMVEDRSLSFETAIDIARQWLYENPRNFYGQVDSIL